MVLFVLAAGCATSAVELERGRKMQVSVKTLGQEAQGVNTDLVHRRMMSLAELSATLSDLTDCDTAKRTLVATRDSQNSLIGLRVTKEGAKSLAAFGFEEGDYITAFNRSALPKACHLRVWISEMQRDGAGSATLQRLGAAHKFLYQIERAKVVR